MNQLIKVALPFLLVGLCLGLTLAFPAFLVTGVMQPVALSLWLAWRMVTSVDQSTYWALLILICCVWLVRVLPPGRRRQVTPESGGVQEPITSISHWQALLRNAQRTDAGEAALRANLHELLEEVVGGGEHAADNGLERRLLSNRTILSPAVHEYLFPTSTTTYWLALDYVHRLGAGFVRWLRRAIGMPAGPDPVTINEVLGWMESMMEMKNDQ